MLPRDLKPEQFAAYPPEARALAVAHLPALRRLPLSFLPSLLREAIEYDCKFPAERDAIDRELGNLSSLRVEQIGVWFHDFALCSVSASLESFDWVNQPAQFVERLSAYLWTTHQLDAFRAAAQAYGERLQRAAPAPPVPVDRLGIAVIGQGAGAYGAPLFRKLRPHGTYFSQVKPEGGLALLLAAVAERAEAHPVPYAHWYVDGGAPAEHSSRLACVSYRSLEPVRVALLDHIQTEIARPGMGPEELRSNLARLVPKDLGMDRSGGDPVMERFQLKQLTEGSGTQIFSTSFAQWTAREALRRAQPLTLLTRFAPRQRQRPMNELLAGTGTEAEIDPIGSLIDADMAAYYQWINQQRLPGAERSSFVVWFEDHGQALAIGPALPRGTESASPVDLRQLLALASA